MGISSAEEQNINNEYVEPKNSFCAFVNFEKKQAGNANSHGVLCNSHTSQSVNLKHSLIVVIFNSATKSAEKFCLKIRIPNLAHGYVHPIVAFFSPVV